MSTETVAVHGQTSEANEASPVTISKKLKDEGMKLAVQLGVNGVEQRDKELIAINLSNHINHGSRPAWQGMMKQVRTVAEKHNVKERVVIDQIADHTVEQLGPPVLTR